MFKKKKKEVLPSPIKYQIVGHSGIRDGAVLKPKQNFIRSWTLLNSSPSTPCTKDKGRAVKLMHKDGIKLKEYVMLLWPVPGKLVTVS